MADLRSILTQLQHQAGDHVGTMSAACADVLGVRPTDTEVRALLHILRSRFCKTEMQRVALDLVKQLVTGATHLTAFPNLCRNRVAYQLAVRVADPRRIQQGAFGFCGPAALVVDIVRSDPRAYVNFAVQLAEQGYSTLGTRRITPRADLRAYNPPLATPHADFLVLASVRDSDEALTDTTKAGEFGGTNPGVFFDWCLQAGYPRVVMVSCPPSGSNAKDWAQWGAFHLMNSTGLGREMVVMRCHPPGALGLSGLDPTDKASVLSTMMFLRDAGWKVFMRAKARIAQAAKFHSAGVASVDDIARVMGGTMTAADIQNRKEDAYKRSLSDVRNESVAAEGHWTLVEKISRVQTPSGGPGVKLRVHSWGGKQSHPAIPLDDFLFNFEGFVAATPLPG